MKRKRIIALLLATALVLSGGMGGAEVKAAGMELAEERKAVLAGENGEEPGIEERNAEDAIENNGSYSIENIDNWIETEIEDDGENGIENDAEDNLEDDPEDNIEENTEEDAEDGTENNIENDKENDTENDTDNGMEDGGEEEEEASDILNGEMNGIPEDGTGDMPEGAVERNLEEGEFLLKEENIVTMDSSDEVKMLLEKAKEALQNLLSWKTVAALAYLAEEVDIYARPGGEAVASVSSGHQVFIRDVEVADGHIWYLIHTGINDAEITGYMSAENLAYSDEDFLAWEKEYLTEICQYIAGDARILAKAVSDADIKQFPSSYQNFLAYLRSSHPNWIFVKMNTDLDWNTVIENEMEDGRNLVPASSPAAWKIGKYDNSWSKASEGIVKYFMDPRNAMTEEGIFQFEQLTYNASYHKATAVQMILDNSFMAGNIPGTGTSYATAFWQIGSELGVSPFHLACRVYQEQGSAGTSPLISGTYPGYEGYYNYYNIGASGTTNEQIYKNGLEKAKAMGWNSRMASLRGGAEVLSKNYILKGQDTLYLQKFDVDSSYNGLYWHQYMQNIKAPSSEAKNVRKAYANAGSLENCFVFKIPVFNNMPSSVCPDPATGQGNSVVDMEGIEAFVERMYTKALGRDAEPEGLEYWSKLLADGEKTGAEVARGFIFGQEFIRKDWNDSQYVEVLYQTFMDRASDSGGKTYWLKAMGAGVSRAGVLKGFAESREFGEICAKYGITRGSIDDLPANDQNPSLTMFVSRMYTKALGRDFDRGGLEDWCGRLLRKSETPESVARGFIFSREMANKNLSDEAYVKVLYRVFMDREYDEDGLKDWVSRLKSGVSREKVLQGFSGSEEFDRIVKSFGL